jgi:hypothetical protein
MSLMTNQRVRHLLVIANGNLVGIVSIGDVVKLRLEDLETETNVLRVEPFGYSVPPARALGYSAGTRSIESQPSALRAL